MVTVLGNRLVEAKRLSIASIERLVERLMRLPASLT